MTAIFTKESAISYDELEMLIDRHSNTEPIFFAPPTVATIVHILSLIRKKIPFCPISPREKALPKISLPSSVCNCLATSGTSGMPKFVLQSLENHEVNARYPHPDLLLHPDDGWLLSLPLNHVGGLAIVLRSFFAKSSIVLSEGPKERVTMVSFVPTQCKRFLQQANPYPRLRALLLGGAAIPPSLCEEARELPLYLTYGMTEMASQVATKRFDRQAGVSFGQPLPFREIKIDEAGEIYVRGKTLFLGYHNSPPPWIEGWFPTGDLGKWGEGGLIVLGRKDRMLISGGENIYPEELERAFLSLPEVTSVVVTKRYDAEYGERPVAMISLSTPCERALLYEKVSALVPKFKVPYIEDIVVGEAPPGWKGSF